jgi:glycosyltransferase involved in cell wall biosynthesis
MDSINAAEVIGIPVVIPSFEPDDQLVQLCESLIRIGICDICIVDDGSGDSFQPIFDTIKKKYSKNGIAVLHHDVNRGKGRALKTAFRELLDHRTGLIGCVTADSDGQHTPEDIFRCMRELAEHSDSLIMGCRRFDGKDVPAKSRFGNELTRKVCRYVCGVDVSDTQTGLRGIPSFFMQELLDVPGERFEFETRMLVACRDKIPIVEVPIETVYDSKEHHRTHFDPIMDSLRIYRIFGAMFLRYIFSAVSSCVLDLFLFALLCRALRGRGGTAYILAATVIARVVSATYNYLINYRFVFQSRKSRGGTAVRYASLALVQMSASALLVTGGVLLLPGFPETLIKVVVDTVLFFISYYLQRKLIF